ncbi:MAG: hypothetical protein ACNA8P_06360 [Phycisphaerales bacterium]
MPGTLARILITLLLAGLVAGCTTPAPHGVPDAETFVPGAQPISSRQFYPDLHTGEATTRTYASDSGFVIDRTAPASESGSGYRHERILAPTMDPESPSATLHSARLLASDESGTVVLLASSTPGRGIDLEYDPTLVVAPPLLLPGEPHEAQTRIHQIDPATGRTTQTGTATFKLELLGERSTQTGSSLLIRSSFEIRLGRSVMRRQTDRIYRREASGDLTLEREEETETVSAMGLTISRTERSLHELND